MAQTINTNLVSLNAQRNLSGSAAALATSVQRISSGLRINSAKDDAAGLSIAERFTTQIRGLGVAVRNANDAISLAQTAEGALGAASGNLQRIRELAVQSANATNSASDRAALQSEAAQLIAETQRVGVTTSFNGLKLLDGSFAQQTFQVGANSGETIAISSIVDARTSALGSNTLVADGTITGGVVTGSSTANGLSAETDLALSTSAGTIGSIAYAANSGADGIATAINNAASGIGITATATNNATLTLGGPGTITFNLAGGAAAGNTVAISAVVTSASDLSNLATAINGVSGTTGVTASFTNGNKASLTLTSSDGRNIGIGTFANTTAGNDTAVFGGTTLTEGGTVSAVQTGTVSLSSNKGPIATATANADAFAVAGVNTSSFTALSTVDISTATGAINALAVLDASLSQVNSGRADLGAIQNRFQSTIANLQISEENQTASRSRIVDADFAAETANLSRAQVLQQAGNAMVAQANQLPQQVLALLRQ
jgi:flagellin